MKRIPDTLEEIAQDAESFFTKHRLYGRVRHACAYVDSHGSRRIEVTLSEHTDLPSTHRGKRRTYTIIARPSP